MLEDVKDYKFIETLNEEEYQKLYAELESANNHALNVVLECGFRGDEKYHKEALLLLEEQDKVGCLSDELLTKRQELLDVVRDNLHSIESIYTTYSSFDTKYDLTKVEDWYIKWGVLYVQPTKDSEYEKFEASYDNFDDFDTKRSSRVYQIKNDRPKMIQDDYSSTYTVYSLRWDEGGETAEQFYHIDRNIPKEVIQKIANQALEDGRDDGDETGVFESLLDKKGIVWKHFVYDIINF
jgi:hypothetical protein